MKASLIGFEWTIDSCITLEEYMAHLMGLKGKPEKLGEYDRLLSVGEKDGYYTGLFLTIKNHKKWTELVESAGGKFKVNVRKYTKGRRPLDFNLFVINKKTGRGLYLHYHNSCSLNRFGLFCKRQFNDLRDVRKKSALEALPDEATAKERRAVRKKYKGSLESTLMVRQEKVEALMQKMKRVATFEYAVTTLFKEEPVISPDLRPYVSRDRRIIGFRPKVDQDNLKHALVKVIKDHTFARGRITGKDERGEDVAYSLIENIDVFGEHDYDSIAEDETLNTDDPSDSAFIKVILGTIEGDPKLKDLFETEAQ